MKGLRIALPSKGALHDPTLRFLEECGLPVRRKSNRHYIGRLGGGEPMQAIFLSAQEICGRVADGTCDIGFTGVDLVGENPQFQRHLVWLIEKLGYGNARLVLAVPESWRDVQSLADVVELAAQWRTDRGAKLRVATKFAHLTRRFLLDSGISDHTLVPSSGATELSNWLKDADIITDLTSTGATLSANRLKEIDGGTIIESEACLIANRTALSSDSAKLEAVRGVLGRLEARLRAKATFVAEVACERKAWDGGKDKRAALEPFLAARHHSVGESVRVTLHVPKSRLDEAMRTLRGLGLSYCRVIEPTLLYESNESAYESLRRRLEQGRDEM